MTQGRPRSAAEVRVAVLDCTVLALASVFSYWLVAHGLARVHSVSGIDDTLGGLWAVIATAFVCRASYHETTMAAVSRMTATSVSFGLCLIYLIFLPFHVWTLSRGAGHPRRSPAAAESRTIPQARRTRAAVAQSQRPADAGQGRAAGGGGDQPPARAR